MIKLGWSKCENIIKKRRVSHGGGTMFTCTEAEVLGCEVHRGVDTWIRVNDPSAGSPTETLLRLLLPLNDQV
jgi:hypothetical protein